MLHAAEIGGVALRAGDPRRPAVGRAVALSIAAGIVFLASTVLAKDVEFLNAVAPWAEDPYDAFVSFAMFFVAGLVAVNVVRILLCRRDEPLPVVRVAAIVRGCRAIAVISTATIAAAWLSVVAHPGAVAVPVVDVLIAALAVNTGLTVSGIVALQLATRRLDQLEVNAVPDFLDDAVLLARRAAPRLGGQSRSVGMLIDTMDDAIAPWVRRHRLLAAGTVAVAFGLIVAVAATIEQDPPILVALVAAIGAGGMLTFVIVTGSYLGLVRAATPSAGPPRLLAPAVAAAAGLPIAVAFRDGLWWIVGSTTERAGIAELAALVAIISIACFCAALLAQAVAGRLRRLP